MTLRTQIMLLVTVCLAFAVLATASRLGVDGARDHP